MASLPAVVSAYLEQISITARAPAFLLVSAAGIVLEAGGELGRYGLTAACAQPLPESWEFLGDFLTMQEEALDLPCMKVGGRSSIDLHLIRSDKGVYIVVLDASAQEATLSLVQQKTNELSLLQGRQQKLVEQYVGTGVAETLMGRSWDPTSQGERKIMTTMFADIRGFTPYSEAAPPGQVFATLNSYLRAMITPITEAGGFIDKLIGDQVMALFGLLPTAGEPAAQAVGAALQIVASVRALQPLVDVRLGVGIGITTGPVALGILGTKERRAFSAIGHHVNVAARLQSQARRGAILIDAASYARARRRQVPLSRKVTPA